MLIDKLVQQLNDNIPMFTYKKEDSTIGYFSLHAYEDGSYELNNLAVLPEYRHLGIGSEMVKFAKDRLIEFKSNKLKIGIIEENTVLKNWYLKHGFVHKGTRKIEHLPFTVGFMEMVF